MYYLLLKTQFWYDTINKLQKQEPYMNLWMDLMEDPLTICPIQMRWEFTIKPYPSWRFGYIDNQDRQFGNGSVWTGTRTCSDSPEPLATLAGRMCWGVGWSNEIHEKYTLNLQNLPLSFNLIEDNFPTQIQYPISKKLKSITLRWF